jgi:hypothetical protein
MMKVAIFGDSSLAHLYPCDNLLHASPWFSTFMPRLTDIELWEPPDEFLLDFIQKWDCSQDKVFLPHLRSLVLRDCVLDVFIIPGTLIATHGGGGISHTRIIPGVAAAANVLSRGIALDQCVTVASTHRKRNKASKADKWHGLLPIDFNHGNKFSSAESSVDSRPQHTCVVLRKNYHG